MFKVREYNRDVDDKLIA